MEKVYVYTKINAILIIYKSTNKLINVYLIIESSFCIKVLIRNKCLLGKTFFFRTACDNVPLFVDVELRISYPVASLPFALSFSFFIYGPTTQLEPRPPHF